MGLNTRNSKVYANILSKDGTIRVRANESEFGGDPTIVKREYELRDGTTGVKYERVYNDLDGIIAGVGFFTGDYGKQLHIIISDKNGDEIILSINLQTNYAEDLMKKLPNIDLSKNVLLNPYSFEVEGKIRKGISVVQDGEKVKSFFHDAKGKPLNDFPKPEGKTKEYDSEDWKMYFMKTKKFLQKYIEDNIQLDAVKDTKEILKGKEVTKEDTKEINPKNIPF